MDGLKLIRTERSLKAAIAKKARTEAVDVDDVESTVEEYVRNADCNVDMIMEDLF
jgi:hypothetical protein